MKTKQVLVVAVLLVTAILFCSFQFQFMFKKGDIAQMSSRYTQYVYLDDKLVQVWEGEHLDKLLVKDVVNDRFVIEGKYDYYESEGSNPKQLIKSDTTEFEQDKYGRMFFSKQCVYPTVRSVPFFPAYDLKPGDKWWAEGEEIFDLGDLGFKGMVATIPFKAEYVYEKDVDNESVIRVFYTSIYGFEKENLYKYNNPELPKFYAAQDELTFYWDRTKGYFTHYTEEYVIYIVRMDGTKWKIAAQSNGEMNIVRQWSDSDKDKLVKDITAAIPDELKKQIEIKKTDKGIVINLGEIFFDFDKFDLKSDQMPKLKVINDILKKYFSGYQIIVEGYTDSVGDAAYNQILSEKRAKTIFDWLVKFGGIDKDLARWVGYGSNNPLYPNDTEEHRKMNRRVQILITDF